MGLLGFGKKKGTTPERRAEVAAAPNQWDGVRDVKYAGEQGQADEQLLTAQRQQRKIIKGLRYGERVGLAGEDAVLAQGDREWVLQGLAEGRIGVEEERKFLEGIIDPVHKKGAQAVFEDGFAGRGHPLKILAAMTDVGFNNYERVNSGQIGEFLDKYPLPMDFEGISAAFLRHLKEHNSPQRYDQYVAAMDFVKKMMYGKRQEYWDQMKVLNAQAARMAQSKTVIGAEWQAAGGETRLGEGELVALSPRERLETLRQTEIDGDNWLEGGASFPLRTEDLEKCGVLPEYKTKLEGREFALSGAFRVGGGKAVLACVQGDDGKKKMRGYYRGGGEMPWMYLPDYARNLQEAQDGSIAPAWLGEGYARESVVVADELQEALGKIERNGVRQVNGANPWFLLAGTARRFSTREQRAELVALGKGGGDFYKEVQQAPMTGAGDKGKITSTGCRARWRR